MRVIAGLSALHSCCGWFGVGGITEGFGGIWASVFRHFPVQIHLTCLQEEGVVREVGMAKLSCFTGHKCHACHQRLAWGGQGVIFQ